MAYPQIRKVEKDTFGNQWLQLANGNLVIYSAMPSASNSDKKMDLKQTMAQIYPLEPARPETPPGFAPGRKRSYAFFEAVYGNSPGAVSSQLAAAYLRGKPMRLALAAAIAFTRACPALEAAAEKHGQRLLKPDGAFMWRKIAGENNQSPHSYGIALDLGAAHAPYWRWAKQTPHPMQKSYPEDIVKAMEKEGFIWGGKWHQYDLMHYEYRPELICKARLQKVLKASGN